MKKVIKYICLILVIALLVPHYAFAAEADTTGTYSLYFTGYGGYLAQKSDTSFNVWYDVCGTGTMDAIGAKSVKIQSSYNGTNWTDIFTYRVEDLPDMICRNTAYHSRCISYTIGTTGHYYRAYITFYAEKGNGYGLTYYYTDPIQL